MTFEFVIEEVRKHVILADGKTLAEAEENALHTFMRQAKRNELAPFDVSEPKIVERERRK